MLVSVVMISYNQEKFIRQAIESVFAQDVDFDIEIIIGDDASQDDTPKIIAELAQKDSRLIPILRDKNLGMNRNFIDIIKRAKGKYLAILEGDDFWIDNNKLNKQVALLEENPDCYICYTNSRIIDDNDEFIKNFYHIGEQKGWFQTPIERLNFDTLINGNFINTASVMYRRIEDLEIPEWFYNLKLGDWPFSLFHAEKGGLIYLNEITSCYRQHSASNWSSKDDVYTNRKTIECFENLLFKYPNHKEQIENQIDKSYKWILGTQLFKCIDHYNAEEFEAANKYVDDCFSIMQKTEYNGDKNYYYMFSKIKHENKEYELSERYLECHDEYVRKNKELHLFIIWDFARPLQQKIIDDIESNFKILEIFDMKWNKESFSNNLTRFYGTNLPPDSFKEKHCGSGMFLLVIVEDEKPNYQKRETSHGPRSVNINMFDKKQIYREWTGGGHRIHSTDNEKEFDHDLSLLLGLNSSSFLVSYNAEWDGTFKPLAKDLEGAKEWKNIEQLFFVLNNTINYIVMRNFESIPDEYTMKEHGDIDLLTDSPQNMQYILNAGKVFHEEYRVLHQTVIRNEKVLFDIRFIGDEYYDIKWEKKLMADKVLEKDCFYRPNETDYFYSLLYHAAIHKKEIAQDYKERLPVIAIKAGVDMDPVIFNNPNKLLECLNEYMIKYNYKITKPVDHSVYYNTKYIDRVINE